MPGDRQHRLAVELGIVQPVEQMNAAGTRGRQADAQLAGVLCIAAGHECGRFLVAHLNETDLVLRAVRSASMMPLMPSPGRPKIVYAPVVKRIDQNIRSSLCHG